MIPSSKRVALIGAGFAAILGSAWVAGPRASARPASEHEMQDGKATAQHAAGGASLAYPTGDRATSAILIETQGPAQVPVGRAYDYLIKVTNLTKALSLENVAIRQTVAPGFAIEKSEPKFQGSEGAATWTIPALAPGESATIRATALGEKEGDASSCFRVTYEPSLCVTTRFIRQEIQLVKEAPKSADICDAIPLRYVLKNTGSGPAREVRLRDALPEGLRTAEGKSEVDVNVGEIAAGESKQVTLNALAEKPGDYTSRGGAQGADGLQAQSNQTTTAIRQSKLAVAIAGPEAQYANEAMTYKVTVKNEGEAPARGAKLDVQADPQARVLRVSKAAPEAPAPQINGNALAWSLGDIAPGKSVDVSLTVVARGKAELKQVATATSACARDAATARGTATAQTEILTLPALLLEMVDQADPIKVGTDEVYTITVFNQGEGDDHNVKIVCNLPEGLTFVKADGPTKSRAEGQKIVFEPVVKLAPKEKLTWTVQAKAVARGDVRTVVELTSDYLTKPVPETEPTRLVD